MRGVGLLVMCLALAGGTAAQAAETLIAKLAFQGTVVTDVNRATVGQLISVESDDAFGDGATEVKVGVLTYDGIIISSANDLTVSTGSIEGNNITTNSVGQFKVSFRVPSVAYGERTVVVRERSTPTYVAPRLISVTPIAVIKGDSLTVVGDGFRSGQAVRVELVQVQTGGAEVGPHPTDGKGYGELTADSTGRVEGTIVVGPAPYADGSGNFPLHSVRVKDSHADYDATVRASLANVVSVSPILESASFGSKNVGNEITVKGRGFPAPLGVGASLSITIGGSVAVLGNADATGSINGGDGIAYTIPAMSYGTRDVKISDTSTGSASATASSGISIAPKLSLTGALQGTTGSTIDFSGTGFASHDNGDPKTIKTDGTGVLGEDMSVTLLKGGIVYPVTTAPGTITANAATGAIVGSFTVPLTLASSGSVTVQAQGGISGAAATTTFLFSRPSAEPELRATKVSASGGAVHVVTVTRLTDANPGDLVGVTGLNFSSSASVGTLRLRKGFTALDVAPGDLTDGGGPNGVAVGTANDTTGEITTDAGGAFSVSLQLPADIEGGTWSIETTGAAAIVAVLDISPGGFQLIDPASGLTVSSITRLIGDSIRVSAGGFLSGETVTIQVGPTAAAIKDNGDDDANATAGVVQADLAITDQPFAKQKVAIAHARGTLTTDGEVAILNSISKVDNNDALVGAIRDKQLGETITLSGRGFTAGSPIQVWLDKDGDLGFNADNDAMLVETTSNSLGGFFAAVPVSNAGVVGVTSLSTPFLLFVRDAAAKDNETLPSGTRATASIRYITTDDDPIAVHTTSGAVGDTFTLRGSVTSFADLGLLSLDGAAWDFNTGDDPGGALDKIVDNGSNDLDGAAGAFQAQFTIPALTRGVHSLKLKNQTITFTVNSKAVVAEGGGDIKVGGTVKINATGFGGAEIVQLKIGDAVIGSAAASSSGSADAIAGVIPTGKIAGAYTINAVGVSSGASVELKNAVTVVPSLVSLTPTQGTTLTSLTVKGEGFTAGEPVTITFDGSSVGDPVNTNTVGQLDTTFTVPSKPFNRDGHEVVLIGSQTGTNPGGKFFLLEAALLLAPDQSASFKVGDKVLLRGSGFGNGVGGEEAVSFSVAGTTPTFVTRDGYTATTDGSLPGLTSNGGFGKSVDAADVGVRLASVPGGIQTLTAVGGTSGQTKNVTLNIRPSATVVSGSSASVGSLVEIDVFGFAKETELQFTVGSTILAFGADQPTKTAANGALRTKVVVADAGTGNQTITVSQPGTTDPVTGGILSATVTDAFAVGGKVTLVGGKESKDWPVGAAVGSSVTIVGSGFTPGKVVNLFLGTAAGTKATLSGNVVQANGSLNMSMVVPQRKASAAGLDLVIDGDPASDEDALVVAVNALQVTASLTVSPVSGTPGTTVLTINGSGFPLGNVTLTIRADSAAAGSGLLVGGNGTANATIDGVLSPAFQAALNPGVSSGPKKIDALDGAGNVLASVDFVVSAAGGTASLTIADTDGAATSGPVGSQVVVTGSGFAGSSSLPVTFDGLSVPLTARGVGSVAGGSVITDTTGAFKVELTAPAREGGDRKIAVGGEEATYTVDSTIALSADENVGADDVVTITGSGFVSTKDLMVQWVRIDAGGSTELVAMTQDASAFFSTGLRTDTNDPDGLFKDARVSLVDAVQGGLIWSSAATSGRTFRAKTDGSFAVSFKVSEVPFVAGGRLLYVVETQSTTANSQSPAGAVIASATLETVAGGLSLDKGTIRNASQDAPSGGLWFSADGLGQSDGVIAVSAKGFAANSSVSVKIGDSTVQTLLADARGAVSGSVTVTGQTAGEKTLELSNAAGDADKEKLSAKFNVLPELVIYGVNGVKPGGQSLGQATLGTSVSLFGIGFKDDGDKEVSVVMGAHTEKDIDVAGDGTFSHTFTLPAGDDAIAGGPVLLQAVGKIGESDTETFTVLPRVTIVNDDLAIGSTTQAAVATNDKVKVSGDGFTANAVVTLRSLEAGTAGIQVIPTGNVTDGRGRLVDARFTASELKRPESARNVRAITPAATIDSTNTFRRAPSITSLSPASGKTGTSITISGQGFPSNITSFQVRVGASTFVSAVTTTEGTVSGGLITPTETGRITASFSAPTLGTTGPISINLVSGAESANKTFVYSDPTQTATLSVISDATNLKPGDTVKVRGYNYNGGSIIGELLFDGDSTLASPQRPSLTSSGTGSWGVSLGKVRSDENGVFEVSFAAPTNTTDSVAGTKYVGTGSTGEVAASVVIQNAMTRSIDTATPGSVVTVNGSGFAPETVLGKIALDGAELDGTGNVDDKRVKTTALGTFAVSVTIPAVGESGITAGNHALTLGGVNTDLDSGDGSLKLVGTVKASATPSTAAIGDLITVAAEGLAPTSGVDSVTVLFDDAKVGTLVDRKAGNAIKSEATSTDAGGDVAFTFNVPSAGAGTHQIRLTQDKDAGGNGNDAIDFGISFTVTGSVVVLPSSGVVGDTVTVTGNGFGASATVFVDFGSASNAATVAANSAGSFTAKFSAPAQPKGVVTVTARSSSATAAGSFTVGEKVSFLVNGKAAEFTAGVFDASVGDNVTVQGDGFVAVTALDVTLGNGQTVSSSTNSVGSVAQTFTVQETSSHTNYQPKVGSFGSDAAHGVEKLGIAATISASPSSARAGDSVVVVGRGFVKSSKVNIYLGKDSAGSDVPATDGSNVSIGATGSFTATVKVGSAVVPNAESKAKAGAAEADFVVLVSEAKLTVKKGADEVSKGTVGTLLTVTPSAATFGASENVELFFANQSIILQQAIGGTFVTNFAVPVTPGGTKQIRAVGKDTGETRTATFDVIPNITSISESLFDLGETVTITGNGAGAGDTLQVMLATAKDDSPLEDAVADTSAPVTITSGGSAQTSGIFQLTFQVNNRIFDQARTQVRLKVVSVHTGVESDWFGKDADISGGLEVITKGVRLSLSQTSGAGDASLTVTGFAADDSGNARLNANIGSVTLQHQFVSSGARVVVPSTDLTVTTGLKEGDTVRTDSSGKFEASFPIGTATQPKPGGLLTVSISGESVNYTITPQLRAVGADGAVTSQLELDNTYTLEGVGFFPQQTISVSFDGSALDTSSVTKTDAFGKFTTTFDVAQPTLGGLHSLSGAGPFSATSTTLAVIGTILTPSEVLQAVVRGDMVDVSGIGFGADEELTFSVGPATIPAADVTDAMSGADGTFASTIKIPAVAAGEHDLVVSSPSSSAILASAFTISSSIAANPDKSKAGADLTVSGSGWSAFAAVSIAIVGENPTTATTDDIGSFSTLITLTGEKADGSVVTVTATSGEIVQTTTFTYDGSAAAQDVAVDPETAVGVDGVITVSANIETDATATFSIAGVGAASAVAMAASGADAPEGFVAVAGSYTAADGEDIADAAVTVAVTDALGNAGDFTADATVTIDTVAPELGDSTADPAIARNGMSFTITVNAEAALASVTADVSDVDTTQTDAVVLEEGDAGVYTATVLVSTSNAAVTGDKTIAVTVADEAGNETTNAAAIAIRLQAETSFTVALHAGVNLIHVPVKVDGLDSASALYEALGGSDDVGLIVMLNDAGKFVAFTSGVEPGSPADVALTDASGVIVVMKRSKAVSFSGGLLGADVSLSQGINVVGVPRGGAVATAGAIADLSTDVQRVIREENGRFVAVVSDATDADVNGGAAYIVLAGADATLTLDGGAWENVAAAAPVTNVAYNTDASPVFLVQGSLAREDTLDVINGIEVTVTNMRTGDSLTDTVGRSSGAGRFATTFLSLGGEEYKVGDTFDLRVVDPSGTFGGVRETQRTITRSEMRDGRIDLGAILLSAVPERSALLPNFPNPFNPETWIPFQLSGESAVKVSIYNAGAERIRTLDLGYLPAGTYASRTKAAYWDGSNELGERVSSGVYFYRIEAGSFSEMRRMVILK